MTYKILTVEPKPKVINRSVVRSAKDPNTRNQRVNFGPIVNADLDKLDKNQLYDKRDGIHCEDITHLSLPIPEKTMENDTSPIATRTRANVKNTQVSTYSPDQPAPTIEELVHIANSVGSKEHKNHLQVHQYKQDKLDQLKYLNYCDKDEQSPLWSVRAVQKHRFNKGNTGRLEVYCLWKDKNAPGAWIPFASMALHDPTVILKYAKSKHIINQPHFYSLAHYCIGPTYSDFRRAFVVNSKQLPPKIKFGERVPRGLKEAYQIDTENKNNDWAKAIETELTQLHDYETFRCLKEGEDIPTGYKWIPYHIVFDVKFDLRKKARLVAGGNRTDPTKEDIYSGVVSMDSIRTGFLLGELNNLTCCAADVGNAFLYGKTKEKVYIKAGREFGKDMNGKILIIVKSLYGLKTSAARFHECLSDKLREMGYRPSLTDADLWMIDKGTHYDYIATYVDDLLIWSRDPMAIIEKLKKSFILKGVGAPEYYLGGDVDQLDEHWTVDAVGLALSAKTYIKNLIPKFEKLLAKTFKSVSTPMAENLHPELDKTPFLTLERTAIYRSIIGSLSWTVTLGRFDVFYATNTLSRFMNAPREGHLQAAERVLGYLNTYIKGRIIYDTAYLEQEMLLSDEHNWTEFYPDAEEKLVPNAPEPKGKKVRVTVYVDADHAHDQVTRRSVTGIILFLNNTPVRYISKRQKTVESSTYGSELVAARIATELIIEVRCMLRDLGVPIDGPTQMFGDNLSVVLNTTVPSSVLKKKHNSIAYHMVREAIAAGYIRFNHIDSDQNIADVLTKPLGKQPFHKLVGPYLFRKPQTLINAQN